MRLFRPALPGLLLLAGALLVSITGCPRPSVTTTPSEPTSKNDTPAPTEPPWFEDVTEKVGLKFTHDPGPLPQPKAAYFMPQIIGSGGAVFDFDGDGRLDIYLIHNNWSLGRTNQLFHQEADGTFRDVSAGSGLDVAGYGQGVAIGDVNNDGRPDVLLTEYGKTRLFLNLGGGKFREITKEAGLESPLWATSAAFFDYDRDGLLDLVVTNYLDYDPSLRCGTLKLDFCTPNSFKGVVTRLYHNVSRDGQVRFEDVTEKSKLGTKLCKGLGVLCADFDGDGWPDIFVANDQLANFLWINNHDGTFREEAVLRNVAYSENGQPLANMGIAWCDIDGDGLPDLFVTHLNDQLHTLWKQTRRGHFQDLTTGAGLNRGWRSTGFGTAFVDFDRDGWPDVAWVNGGVFRNRGADAEGPFWAAYAQRNQLFANTGGGKFRDISESNPALCGSAVVARGLIVADLDNDGAPDLITTEIAGPARVLRNIAPAKGHWLAVRALLPKCGNRDAYGSEVTVRAGGRSFWRLLNPGYSYCVSNDPRCHFGLGPSNRYDNILVAWPDGAREEFAGGAADREVVLRQGEGQPQK